MENTDNKEQNNNEMDFDSLPEKTKAEIKKLREENANRRTTAKELEDKYNKLASEFEKLKTEKQKQAENELKEQEKYKELYEQKLESLNNIEHKYKSLEEQKKELEQFQEYVIDTKLKHIEDEEFRNELKKYNDVKLIDKILSMQKIQNNSEGAANTGKPAVSLDKFKQMGQQEQYELSQKDPELYHKLKLEQLTKK